MPHTLLKSITILSCIFIVLCAARSDAAPQTIRLPITIDYPLLRNLLAGSAFPEKGETVTLINEGGGCTYLVLSSPQISESNKMVRLEIQVSARVATPLGNECFSPLNWQGYLVLYQQPSITTNTWQLSFTTLDSELLGANRQPTKITDILWNIIRPHIVSYLNSIHIDLMPPVTGMKDFLLPLFSREKQEDARKILDSMRPGYISTDTDALRLAILAEVENVITPDTSQTIEEINEEDLRKTIAIWENWDGLLVYLTTALSRQVLSEEEKRILINVLLDTRYRFITDLSNRTIPHDIVRQQFVSAWQQLAPIFRKHILRGSQASMAFGYLAFVASADSLQIFDGLGPTFELDISVNGLVRLARMLQANPALLQYRSEINLDLQKLFQFEPDKAAPQPLPVNTPDSSSLQSIFASFFATAAYAAEPRPSLQNILQWQVPRSDVGGYIDRIKKILVSASNLMIENGKVPTSSGDMYRTMIPAMAWQESCFRQFVVKGDKLTYLLSYNNTSVGLMQVNERVWRGLFDLNRLRWDINYNAAAGCEIAAYYLSKYALREKKEARQIIDSGTLARLVYAMYNGGPSQYDKFLTRLKTNTVYESDTLFWEKFSQVSAGKISKVSICLIGKDLSLE